jgi:protoporphyrinogen/coproporphyrinogen III oxidase
MFITLKDGLGTLPDALAAALPGDAIRRNCRVRGLKREGDGWKVETPGETLEADALVLAVPARVSAELLGGIDAELAAALGAIEYAGAAVVNFIFERSQIAHAMDGIGAVIPAVEKRNLIAFSFSSVKFEGRAPEGKAVVRVFMGGALQPEIAGLQPDELESLALRELRTLIGVTGDPAFSLAQRHAGAMPQYHVGHLERVAKIRELAGAHPTLAVIGNGFDGVGIPDCIRNANEGAARLREHLEHAG